MGQREPEMSGGVACDGGGEGRGTSVPDEAAALCISPGRNKLEHATDKDKKITSGTPSLSRQGNYPIKHVAQNRLLKLLEGMRSGNGGSPVAWR